MPSRLKPSAVVRESQEKQGAKHPRALKEPDNPYGVNKRRITGELEAHCSDAGQPENLHAACVEQAAVDAKHWSGGQRSKNG